MSTRILAAIAIAALMLVATASATVSYIYFDVNSSEEGYLGYNAATTYSNLHNAATADDVDTSQTEMYNILNAGTCPTLGYLYRAVGMANTGAALPDDAIIDSAVVGIASAGKDNGLGSPAYILTGFNPATNGSLVGGDYDGYTSVLVSSNMSYASIDEGGSVYNNFTVTNLGYISKTSYTNLMIRDEWDVNGVFTGSCVNGANTIVTWVTSEGTPKPFIAVTWHSASGSAPTASFTKNSTGGNMPVAVQFNDTSTNNPQSWAWNFTNVTGNNTPVTFSTERNASITFGFGNFSIKLKATNPYGSNVSTAVHWVNVSMAAPDTHFCMEAFSAECWGALTCNTSGAPIGGGTGYTTIFTSGTYNVVTKAQLISALSSAGWGDRIFVYGNASIDLTGTDPLVIPAGVTLASDRGNGTSTGALIERTANKNGGWLEEAFLVGGQNVRVTGLHLRGEMLPVGSTSESEQDYLVGVKNTGHNNLEVDNNWLQGWSWASVENWGNNSHIHHNLISNNSAEEEGYGYETYGNFSLVDYNIFDCNRHDIAAGGLEGERYTAEYNYITGACGAEIGGPSHFDVHGGSAGGYSGYEYIIRHNTMGHSESYFAGLQGDERPIAGIYIDHNVINWPDAWGDRPVFASWATGPNAYLHVSSNYIGDPPTTLAPDDTDVVMYTG